MYVLQVFNYVIIIVEKHNKEIQKTMLKARDAKYSVPIRYGKVLFCGAAAAGKSNFLNLLMKEEFQQLHISTEVLKPQQVTIAMKAVISSNDDEVEFQRMQIDDEILQLESYLPKKYNAPTTPLQKFPLQVPSHKPAAGNLAKGYTTSTASFQKYLLQSPTHYSQYEPADNSKLALANVKKSTKNLNKRSP